jgi:hypothetical protein
MLLHQGKRLGFEFKRSDAPSTSKSMHAALNDLGLDHLWVVYPGSEEFPLAERMSALPITELPEFVKKLSAGAP